MTGLILLRKLRRINRIGDPKDHGKIKKYDNVYRINLATIRKLYPNEDEWMDILCFKREKSADKCLLSALCIGNGATKNVRNTDADVRNTDTNNNKQHKNKNTQYCGCKVKDESLSTQNLPVKKICAEMWTLHANFLV